MSAIKKMRLLYGLAWKVSPAYVLMLLLSILVTSGQMLTNVILPKYLIDELTGAQDMARLLLFGGGIVLCNGVFALLQNGFKAYLSAKNQDMAEMLRHAMATKIMDVEYAHLETPKSLDLKERAVFAIQNQNALIRILSESADFLKQLVTAVSLVAVLCTLSLAFAGALLGLVGLGVWMYARFTKEQFAFLQSIIPINRKYGYYIGVAQKDPLQKDIRLYGMQDLIADKILRFNRAINEQFVKVYQIHGRFAGKSSILTDFQAALTYGYVGLRVCTDSLGPRLSLGSFTLYISAAIQFTKAASQLSQSIINLTQVLDYLTPFAQFMALPDAAATSGSAPFPGPVESIRFDHVTFQYPGSDKPVLEDVSFEICPGEKVSIVGLNGAGKTTLVKLLCRLYHPTDGVITVNGRDIFDYDHGQYMAQVSAVFQDYKLFAHSLAENIAGGAGDGARIRAIAQQVGILDKADALPQGLDTLLGKAYNEEGTEFSGGEQQKIAIARALYKDASLVILDEPTSALDPLAEAEIYENFNALVGDKTALYISHRMSSSVFCDRILILNGGKVEDFDTHAQLMAKKDGLYYQLFMSQAENYRLETEAGD